MFLADQPREQFHHWFIPDDLVDFSSFIAVGSMHNASYIGGLIGLLGESLTSYGRRGGQDRNRQMSRFTNEEA